MTDKKLLRSKIRAEISGLDGKYTAMSDNGISANLCSLPEFAAAGTVFAYASVGREVATERIIARALELGKRVCLPRTMPGGAMDFADISAGLHEARFGIPEPDGALPPVEPEKDDLIVVPALCCDRRGIRLGQGGGYYDRFLARYPAAVKACLCRERLLMENVPAEWNDIAVDYVITEASIIKVR